MDTMFSDYRLTVDRLAELLTTRVENHESAFAHWVHDDARQKKRRNFYRLTRDAITSLHRRDRTVHELRGLVVEWQIAAAGDAKNRDRLTHNARATTEYLDQHGERQLVVLPQQRLETLVGRVRVTAAPHMFALCGSMPTRLWIDCAVELDEPAAIAKCYATIWSAERMRLPFAAVEVVHSAKGRIVARDRLSPNFEESAVTLCSWVQRSWRSMVARVVVE